VELDTPVAGHADHEGEGAVESGAGNGGKPGMLSTKGAARKKD
jgi:hypothetical protein